MVQPKLIVSTEALADGSLTRRDLRRCYTKVYRNVYARTGVELTALDRAHAAWLWSGRRATLVGHSASAVLGSRWIPSDAPVELAHSRRPAARGIAVRSGELRDDEVCQVDGISCTTPARTAYDLGRRLPLETAVIRIDALLNATNTVESPGRVDRAPLPRRACHSTIAYRVEAARIPCRAGGGRSYVSAPANCATSDKRWCNGRVRH